MSGNLTSKIADRFETRDTIVVAIAGFTILIWDHLVTFDDEVEFIWKREKGLVVYLFLLNRYLTPLGFIVNIVAYTLGDWGTETCHHFVRYEGAMTVIGIQVAGIIMFLRIRALYYRNRTVIWSIILLFFVWLGVNVWLLTHGIEVNHPSQVKSCTMIFNTSPGYVASASAWLPLLYDTCVFALTLYKTKCRAGHLVRTLFSDGILYYSVLCMVNVVLTIMITRTGPGVKNITAQLELLLTVAMVSRITLNLRKQALEDTVFLVSTNGTPSRPPRTMRTRSGSEVSARIARTRQRANTAPSAMFGRNGIAWAAGTRSRASTVASSTTPRRNNITFRSEPECMQLSTIYSISLTPVAPATPVEASPVNEEVPRVEKDVEANR